MGQQFLDKIDNSKYFLAGAAIISSLSRENLLSELGKCFPSLFENDLAQIIITASSIFIFVRDARISIYVSLLLYIFIYLVYTFTNRDDCLENTGKVINSF
jgi:hypothetical protein